MTRKIFDGWHSLFPLSLFPYSSYFTFLTTWTFWTRSTSARTIDFNPPPPKGHHLDYRSHSRCFLRAICYVTPCRVWQRDFPTGSSRGSSLLVTHSENEKGLLRLNEIMWPCIKGLKLVHCTTVKLCGSAFIFYPQKYLISEFLLNLELVVHTKMWVECNFGAHTLSRGTQTDFCTFYQNEFITTEI